MTLIVRWQTAQEEVTVVTSSEEVDSLSGGHEPLDAPDGLQVFLSKGCSCVELAAGTPLHQRVAAVAARLHRPLHA